MSRHNELEVTLEAKVLPYMLICCLDHSQATKGLPLNKSNTNLVTSSGKWRLTLCAYCHMAEHRQLYFEPKALAPTKKPRQGSLATM